MTESPTKQGDAAGTVIVDEEHIPALAEFFAEAWDSRSSPDELAAVRRRQAARNPVDPGEPPPSFAFLVEDRVVGYITTIPVRLWDGGSEIPASWLKGFMVLPEFRNGPVGHAVLKTATAELGTAAGFVVAEPARRLFGALGYVDVVTLSNDVLPLSPGRVAARLDLDRVGSFLPGWALSAARFAQRSGIAALGGAIAGVPSRALAGLARLRSGRFRVVAGLDQLPAEALDDLWRTVRSEVGAAAVRDGRYLRWRYGDDDAYSAAGVFDGDVLLGLAIVRRAEAAADDAGRQGVRVPVLSDLLYPPSRGDVARAVLAAAEREARRAGADALLCSVSHPAVRSALRRYGFVSLPGTVHFLLRKGQADVLPEAASAWWLTRGDASSDEGVVL